MHPHPNSPHTACEQGIGSSCTCSTPHLSHPWHYTLVVMGIKTAPATFGWGSRPAPVPLENHGPLILQLHTAHGRDTWPPPAMPSLLCVVLALVLD